MAYKPMQRFNDSPGETDAEIQALLDQQLGESFCAYRQACPDPEPSANFMPGVWSKIEARQASTNVFGRMARALVGAALAASIILGMMLSTGTPNASAFDDTYLEAITADHVSTLDPMNLDRISEMEQQ